MVVDQVYRIMFQNSMLKLGIGGWLNEFSLVVFDVTENCSLERFGG